MVSKTGRQSFLYYYKFGHVTSETKRKICQALGKDAVSTKTARLWSERFCSGDFSLEDGQRSGRPTDIDQRDLMRAIESDQTLTTRREVTSKLRGTHGAIH